MGEFDRDLTILGIKVTEANFQSKREKVLFTCNPGVVLAYHGAPLICHLCKTVGAVVDAG